MKNFTKFLSLFLLSAFSVLKSQQIIIKDSLDGKPLAFSQIIIGKNSHYADSLGQFKFIDEVPSFIVRKPGYESKLVKNLKKDIFLTPKMFEIPEVEIKKKELISVTQKIKKNHIIEMPIDLELGIILKNPYNKTGIIKELIFPINKLYNNDNARLIILFYKIDGVKIEDEPIPYSEIVIDIEKLSRKNNTINILENAIEIPPQGILMSLKVIEDSGIIFEKKSVPSFNLSVSTEKGYIFAKAFSAKDWENAYTKSNVFGISYTAYY